MKNEIKLIISFVLASTSWFFVFETATKCVYSLTVFFLVFATFLTIYFSDRVRDQSRKK